MKNYKAVIFSSIFLILIVYIAIFTGRTDDGFILFQNDKALLDILRFPRVTRAVIAGMSIATAGLFMQAVTKNPLAEPYITGISSGAGLGIVLSVLFLNTSAYSIFGFAGSILAGGIIILLYKLNQLSITKLILVGLSLNMFVSSIIALIIILNPDKSYFLTYILSGGLNFDGNILFIFILFISILLLSATYIPNLNYVRLDENIINTKVKNNTIFASLIISSILTAISVLLAGILGFIGIIAPQISKMLVKNDYRYIFFVNLIIGAIFLVLSDYIARMVIYPLQAPLGLVIAIAGAPIFVWFLLSKRLL